MAKFWRLLVALALLGSAFALRAPFLGRQIWNLDEGSTFTMAQQILAGDVLYRDAADNRTPLVPYLKAALLAVFGDWNAKAMHVWLALMMGVVAIGLWRFCRWCGDEATGIASAVAFTFLSFLLIHHWDVLTVHTGWFLLFFSLLGFLLFARLQARAGFRAGLAVGLCFGIAALCKQPGILDLAVTLIVAALLAVAQPDRRRGLLRLIAGELCGALLVLAASFAYFAANGALDDYLYYAWTYNTKIYVPEVPLPQRLAMAQLPFRLAWSHVPAALFLGLGGLLLLLWRIGADLRAERPRIQPLPWLILGWAASGLASTVLSGRDFSHYCIQLLPGLSLAGGWMVVRASESLRNAGFRPRAAGALLAVGLAGWLVHSTAVRLRIDVQEDPVPLEFGRLVQRHTRTDERIFVWGYAPELHFFAHRLPATRFIYSVFLTGFVPWTNLDSRVDTRYAVVPGSWDRLRDDFGHRPPAMIVDASAGKGFRKYPLQNQPWLWEQIVTSYALVEQDAAHPFELRFFRRLAPATEPGVDPATLDESPALELKPDAIPGDVHLPILRVHAPPGVTQLDLYRGSKLLRRLPYPRSPRVDAAFFVPEAAALGDDLVYRVVARRGDRLEASAPVDLGRYLRETYNVVAAPVAGLVPRHPPGPALRFGPRTFEPVSSSSLFDVHRHETERNRWQAHAPSRLVYAHVPGMTAISVGYGLDPYVYYDRPGQRASNGADFLVEYLHADGRTSRLFYRRLLPKWNTADRGVLTTTIPLPPRENGFIVFRTLPGPDFDMNLDWTFWTDMTAQSTGPLLRFGTDWVEPLTCTARGGEPVTDTGNDDWLAHTPARFVYPFRPGLHAVRLTYGIDPRAYDGSQNGRTDGIVVRAVIEAAGGAATEVFQRRLHPAAEERDRGPQTDRIVLPGTPWERLVFTLEPGPYNDPAFDWSYVHSPEGQGIGPAIEVDAVTSLVSAASRTLQGGPVDADADGLGRWGSHAPAELVFIRPAWLAAVDFGFGLGEGAYADPAPNRRTDGIEVVVTFERPDGTRKELFRRALDPVRRPDDRGPQRARVALPAGEPGRLIFAFTAGPAGDASYDWSYWTAFTGERVP